jgi:hypothetical protein
VVGTDNWNQLANSILAWDFSANPLAGQRVFHNNDWYNPPANHISHTNAKAGVPMNQQYACGSHAAAADSAWANEVICFRLDGSLQVLVVAPVMIDMNSPVGGDGYAKAPKGNLDVTGQYFIWTSNTGGSRVDAFIAKVPSQVLMGGGVPVPDITPPVISGVAANPSSSTTAVTWATNEASDSQVEYGLTSSYGSATALNPSAVSSHTASLSGLAPSTLYHYRVKSRDAAGNPAISPDFTVTTLASAPTPPPSGAPSTDIGGGGGGGCTLHSVADVDPLLPLLLGLATIVLYRHRPRGGASHTPINVSWPHSDAVAPARHGAWRAPPSTPRLAAGAAAAPR